MVWGSNQIINYFDTYTDVNELQQVISQYTFVSFILRVWQMAALLTDSREKKRHNN